MPVLFEIVLTTTWYTWTMDTEVKKKLIKSYSLTDEDPYRQHVLCLAHDLQLDGYLFTKTYNKV